MQQQTMQAWQFAGADQPLTLGNITLPALADDEILIDNQASGINPVDWKFIEGNPLDWPVGQIPGVDGAGIVVGVGSGVDSSMAGRRVAYHNSLQLDGSYATYTVLKANRVMQLPDALPFDLAAALPCPMLTAWQAVSKIPVSRGALVLVAGLGSVNKLSVQLLNKAGFEVHALSGSLNQDEACALGITEVHRFTDNLPQQYYGVIDAVGPEHAAGLVPLLKANGHIVCVQGRIEQPVDEAFTRTISYHEVALGALHQYGDSDDWTTLMQEGEALLGEVISEQLTVESPAVYAFSKMNEALKHSKQTKEKTVIGKAV
ncbi:alcohol dehydrogenase catalytic domain-containing protein [Salinimonas lutimaris]|uniref:alcohol dehydrogenase catalytic domain-containing protein n=1 Tax=Salinimonas lutimaris TaxID=914153 RepID=UPI001E3E20C6|nr:alcohol dehydrogenase catalytic domain-containing protein [Salinimonas lutimaris]